MPRPGAQASTRLRTRSEPEGGTTRLDSMAPVRRHLTSPGSPDAYKRCSARNNPRLVRGAPSKRTAAAARPRWCKGSIGGSICVATLIKRTLPPLSTHHPPVTPLISPSLPTAQGLAQAEKPKPAWSGPSQPKSLHGRGDGEATSIRSSCAPARCFAAATCAPRTSGRASLMDSEDHGSSAAGSRPAQPEGAAL